MSYQQLNEKILNRKLAQYEVDKMLEEIGKITPLKEENYYDHHLPGFKDIYFILHFREKELKFINQIDKVINKYKNIVFPKINIVMKCIKYEEFNWIRIDDVPEKGEIKAVKYTFTLKNYNLLRANPKRFLYHCSDQKNRSSIEEKGLIPKSDMDSPIWKRHPDVVYPPAIFASGGRLWNKNEDIWVIDTEGLPNKWWMDLYYKKGDNDYVFTFEPIPPDHIKRVENLEFVKRKEKLKKQ